MSTKRNERDIEQAASAPETEHAPGDQVEKALTSGRIFRPAEELPPVFVWELYELGRRMVADYAPEELDPADRQALIPPSYPRPSDTPVKQLPLAGRAQAKVLTEKPSIEGEAVVDAHETKSVWFPPELPADPNWDREAAAGEQSLRKLFETFMARCTEQPMTELGNILHYWSNAGPEEVGSLIPAIVHVMFGGMIAAPLIFDGEKQFDGAGLIQRVTEISQIKRKTLLTCLEALENYGGSTTPAEDLINSLLLLYQLKMFTPEDVKIKFKDFCETYDSIEDDAIRFFENNPDKFEALRARMDASATSPAPEAA